MRYSVTGSGDYNVICKVCGWKLKASQARKRWDGLQPVCPVSCWEPRHVLDFYKPKNDFHKLPYTSPDPATLDGFFPSNLLPDDDDVVGVANAPGGPSISDTTIGHYFTCNETGYFEAVRLYSYVPVGQTAVGDSYPAYAKVPLNPITWIGIWTVTGPTLLWSTTVNLVTGQWNTVQVNPNVACTSGTQYCVGVSNQPSYLDVVTLPAQRYATSDGTYSHASDNTFPTSAQAGITALVDIKIRKTT